MSYTSLKECLLDLEKHGHLIRVKEEVDPHLEMAAIHLRVFKAKGPAVLFENVKGCQFQAVSNLFGSLERSRFIFRDTLDQVKRLIELKNDPMQVFKKPFSHLDSGLTAFRALPLKSGKKPVLYKEISISELPQIKCWPDDGGAFITLPQVYTEDVENPGVMQSNLGMYRIQLSGNDYLENKELGLHYQLHRGIGVHQTKANAAGKPLKVSIFIGGPPSHSFAAVMPLPEGMSELTFAGALGGRRFRYATHEGYVISCDADFVITGEVWPNENKPEGPFGDHLGYYSLRHDFPLMKVHKVWHRKDAIWPFTVVGRPPQEDTQFGALIHEITGPIIPKEIPGLYEVNAVDAAGVHPLLLAIGSERYTPYLKEKKPQEILTIANHILGFGQMSLAKYLFIVAKEDNPKLSAQHIEDFFIHVLERVNWARDLHFHTNTTIDTLDYSGTGINSGSKVVIAAAGSKIRELTKELPGDFSLPEGLKDPQMVLPGILAFSAPAYEDENTTQEQIKNFSLFLKQNHSGALEGFPLLLITDDSAFTVQNLNNFLWTTFTRSNPSHDIHGIDAFTAHKHWGCHGPLIIDCRIKPHHAPPLIPDPETEKKVDRLGEKGGSLFGVF